MELVGSDALQWPVRAGRQPDLDAVADAHRTAEDDDSHEPSAPHPVAVLVPVPHLPQETWLERLDLRARIAKPGHRNERRVAEPEDRSDWEVMKGDAGRRDVLAEISRCHHVPGRTQLVEELGGDEVYLAKVGLAGVSGNTRAVLDERSGVGISFDTDTGDQLDLID